MIQINKAIAKKDISKISNATNIFNLMKSELKKDPSLKKFILDFAGINSCSQYVFREVFKKMQVNLNGQYIVELVNAAPAIAMTFNLAVKQK